MTTEETETQRSTGRVKWFNNRSGYGFITVISGEKVGDDIFVHHSSLNVSKEQYKYLIQGEYVEFDWMETQSEEHKWQASNVSGVNSDKLMCETRNENRGVKTEKTNSKYKLRGDGPRSSSSVVDTNGVEWMLVKKRNQGNTNKNPKQYRT